MTDTPENRGVVKAKELEFYRMRAEALAAEGHLNVTVSLALFNGMLDDYARLEAQLEEMRSAAYIYLEACAEGLPEKALDKKLERLMRALSANLEGDA